jgi:diketogulonate reductase-like aldo/keto reductase
MDLSSKKTLNNGVAIPWVALGVWRASNEETERAVSYALKAGYRHIDTARYYNNESGVGKAVEDSGIPRAEIFLSTKIWNDDMRSGKQLESFEQSLKDLRTDYVDLYLIHWPVEGFFVETWKIMEDIYASGRARAIGVCNFHEAHLEKLLEKAKVVPTVDQIERHPYLAQTKLIAFCEKQGIACEAWSPLGGSWRANRGEDSLLENSTLKAIGAAHGKSAAQAVLRWDLQSGLIVLPKSVHEERIVANSQLFDFTLSQEEMQAIAALDRNKRMGPNPDSFDF